MANVVVVGAGLGGLASAARLAKLGHEVTLLERSDRLGGALSREELDGFSWDSGPTSTLLPAVLRDLFRKSGRPLERELELQPLPLVREHRFEDGSTLALPGESRAAQLDAFDGLAAGLGQQWVSYVETFGEAWALLRKEWYERPWNPEVEPRALRALLSSRESLHSRLKRTFKDPRPRLVAAHSVVAAGHDPRNAPAWAGLGVHLEERFGSWTVSGGMAALGVALAERLRTRGVTVRTGVPAHDIVVRGGHAVGVTTPEGEVDADVVVVAIDPRRLPALAPHVRRTMPSLPPVICHVGLEGEVPGLPHEVVLHGDPMLVLHTSGSAPTGGHAWTVHGRGRLAEDVLVALARHGIDVRAQVVARIDHSPKDLVDRWGGSPLGMAWRGPRTSQERLGPRTPIPGVLAAGAHATTGSGLPFVGLSAALVADVVGPA